MATYTLTLVIDSRIMAKLSSDNLNIAKKVNGEFTTSFQGASINPTASQKQLLQFNMFQCREEYSVFLSVDYNAGMQISAATLPKPIKFGEKTKFENSVLTQPETVGPEKLNESNPSNAFLLCDIPDYLRAAVSCKVGAEWAPIYADSKIHNGTMDKELTPLNEVCISVPKYVIS